MHEIGIEFITAFGMPPVDFVHLAADLDCRHIGLGLAPMPPNPHAYPAWSLRDDAALRRDVITALKTRGVSISLGEGFLIRPGVSAGDYAADLDVMCELGAQRINTLSIDPDLNRSFDQLAALAEMAGAKGLDATLEYAPIMAIRDLETALAAIRHVGRANFRLLIDTLHFVRAGGRPEDIAALDPNVIGYVQISDAPLAFTFESYAHEARCERMAPGHGELPLREIVAALPRDCILGLEIPMLRDAEAGLDPHIRIGRCVTATRDLLTRLK